MATPKASSLSLGIMGGPAPLDLPMVPQPVVETSQCGCSAAPSEDTVSAQPGAKPSVKVRMFVDEVLSVSKRLLPLFVGFTFVGYFLNGLIPAAWITSLFGTGHAYGIPLAATLGLPFYINTEASLPLVRAMLDSGMSQGAALAFLITGAGTSLGALGGALTIARWRVIAIVIGTLWAGSILIGITYNFFIS
jgi:hypothetical protein